MQLFHNNILEKTLGSAIPPIPEMQLEILQNWKEKIENGSLKKQTEVAIHAPFTQNIMAGVIPIAERNDWQDYFEGEKTKIAELTLQIAAHEAELNNEVYSLFDLTPQEIALIEAEVQP